MVTTKQHVAVFAFPFGSHPLPLLSLVRNLAHAAPTVTFSFFNTAKSNDSLFLAQKSAALPPNVKPRSVPDGAKDGHVFSGNPLEAVGLFLDSAPVNLLRAAKSAAEEEGVDITCLMADAFVSSSAEIAAELSVPWVPVWLPLSLSLPMHANTKLLRQLYGDGDCGKPFGDVIPGLTGVTVADFPGEILADRESSFSRSLSRLEDVLPSAKFIVINFYEELNPPLSNSYMKSKYANLLNVGFLTAQLPPPPPSADARDCLSWLDGQEASSVAYVSFGTVLTPPPHELRAVAEALEEAKVPYLWSLKESAKGMLPEGFAERTEASGSGKIVSWAPQVHVLGHDAVGAFVTHCGCNSVFESVACGVPLICRPFFGDHRMCGWMVEEYWGVGVRLDGGAVTKTGLIEKLKVVMEDKGMRERAREVKKKVWEAAGPGGVAAQDFKTLVNVVCGV